MKTSVKSFVVLISCGLFACQPGKQIIQGETGDLNTNKMYLCEVVSDYWKSHRAVDSADVIDGSATGKRDRRRNFLESRGGFFGSKISCLYGAMG